MKKTIISLAIAAGMAASGAALAGATVYGNLHLSIESPDNDGSTTDSMVMDNNTSAIGVKGSEDLGDGMKAFYKAEFQLDPSTSSPLTGRDQYIGLKGGMGTVKLGSMSSNYKQMGGKVDPMYRTALEGRTMGMQSGALHGGSGRDRGRMDDALQYASPKMGGMQLVINTQFAGADTSGDTGAANVTDIDETMGVGFRYTAKSFSFYVDMIDISQEDTVTVPGPPIVTTGLDTVTGETATKFGGTFKAGPVKLGAQIEQTEDLLGNDYMMISANYGLDKNNAIYFSYGTKSDAKGTSDTGSASTALMYNHKMSKMTNVYVGYGSKDEGDNSTSADYSVMTAGMRVKF